MEPEYLDAADQAAERAAARQRAIAVAGKARGDGDEVCAQLIGICISFTR